MIVPQKSLLLRLTHPIVSEGSDKFGIESYRFASLLSFLVNFLTLHNENVFIAISN